MLLTSSAFSKIVEEKEEYTADSLIQDTALKNYYNRFLEVTNRYNSLRGDKEKFSTAFNDIKEQHKFYRWIEANGVKALPKAEIKDSVATIKLGDYEIKYSIETLMKQTFLVNGQPIKFKKLEFNEALSLATKVVKKPKKVTLIDLLIPAAHADAMDRFEKTVVATMIYVNMDFSKADWCILCNDENDKATKKNVDKVISQAHELLDSCENETLPIDELYSNVDYFEGTDDTGGFRSVSVQKLRTFFPSIESELKDISCEKLVKETYFKGEKVGLITKTGLDYRSSQIKLDEREALKRKYVKTVKEKCDVFAQLNSCMLSNYWGAQDVYDEGRDPGEKKYDRRRPPSTDYQIRLISQ